MRLDISKLLYKPNYFQENPITLLHFTMSEWNGHLYPLNRDAILHMRRIYTDCLCTSEELVWQKTIVENQEVEIIACNDCYKWSLIMSSKNEQNEFREGLKRKNLCQEDTSTSGRPHSVIGDERVERASTARTMPTARHGFRAIFNLLLENPSIREVSMYALLLYSFLWAPTLSMELLKIK